MSPAEEPLTDESFEDLLTQVRPKLRRVLAKYRIPYHDAEDLLQEALLVALRTWETIESKEGWLLVTLSHKCSIYWRKRRRSLFQAVDAQVLEDLAAPQRAPQEREEMALDLDRLLGELDARHRALLRLRYGLGYSTAEVAELLGYHHSSVRKLTCRAVERLQRRADGRGRRIGGSRSSPG